MIQIELEFKIVQMTNLTHQKLFQFMNDAFDLILICF